MLKKIFRRLEWKHRGICEILTCVLCFEKFFFSREAPVNENSSYLSYFSYIQDRNQNIIFWKTGKNLLFQNPVFSCLYASNGVYLNFRYSEIFFNILDLGDFNFFSRIFNKNDLFFGDNFLTNARKKFLLSQLDAPLYL